MNIINAVGQYKADYTTPKGDRALLIELPGTGKGPKVPIYLIPPRWAAAKDSCAKGAFKEDTHLLISGRLYLGKDYKMYVIPTQKVFVVSPGLTLNHVSLAGGVGYIEEEPHNPDVFNFGISCQATPQISLDISKEDISRGRGTGFRIESWGEDAKRLKLFLWKGRSLSLGGTLRWSRWEKNGEINSKYTIRVKSNQYSFFGDNLSIFAGEDIKNGEELYLEWKRNPNGEPCKYACKKNKPTADKTEIFDSPHHQAIAKPTTASPDIKDPVDDGVPF